LTSRPQSRRQRDKYRYVLRSGAAIGDEAGKSYFNWVEIDPKVVLSLVPMPLTVVMMTIEIPAAISPYSIAVAAFSSLRNL
jgi:hypothetical protein